MNQTKFWKENFSKIFYWLNWKCQSMLLIFTWMLKRGPIPNWVTAVNAGSASATSSSGPGSRTGFKIMKASGNALWIQILHSTVWCDLKLNALMKMIHLWLWCRWFRSACVLSSFFFNFQCIVCWSSLAKHLFQELVLSFVISKLTVSDLKWWTVLQENETHWMIRETYQIRVHHAIFKKYWFFHVFVLY